MADSKPIPMMSTPYSVLYDSVISKLKSYDFINLNEDEAYEILHDYLRPAIVKFKCCKQNLKSRNDDIQTFYIELTDDEIEILSNWMFIRYLEANYINIPTMLKGGLVSAKDFHSLNIAPHLGKLIEIRDMYKKDNQQLMSAYSYENSGLFDKTTPQENTVE